MARFASLFLGVFLLLAGFGLSASLVSLTLAQRDLTSWVGWVGAAYFVGLGLGSLRGAAIVARVGVLRAYGVLSAVGCLGILMLVVVDDPLAWLLARGLQGVALGGLYVCIESWLGASVEASSRGWVLGVYQVVVYLGLGVGQLLMGALAFDLGTALVVAAMCLCLAALPVGSTRQVPPDLDDTVALGLRELWGLASVGLVGAAVSGVTTGAVYAVAPAAGVVAGLDDGQVAWFMASFIGGGLVLQMPLGKASDVLDRRLVLAATGALTAVGALLSMAMVGRPGALIAAAGCSPSMPSPSPTPSTASPRRGRCRRTPRCCWCSVGARCSGRAAPRRCWPWSARWASSRSLWWRGPCSPRWRCGPRAASIRCPTRCSTTR